MTIRRGISFGRSYIPRFATMKIPHVLLVTLIITRWIHEKSSVGRQPKGMKN